jgi:hypothetical protein
MFVSMYTSKCNMQHLNNGFNKFKVDDSIYVKMLISFKKVKKLTKSFKYNYKTLSCICFNIF